MKRKVTIRINDRNVTVPDGSSLLEAATQAGVAVPMLCWGRHLPLAEACRLCLVEVEGEDTPVPACATPVREGLVVRTDSERVREEQRTIFRLLLSDHYGDCLAPCSQRCPANIDIQGYLALAARGRDLEACRLIRRTNPLPLTCGRVCPHPCESECRRNRVDQPVNINQVKRYVSDVAYRDLARLNPPRAEATGRRVAVIGGGPAGLTAAYFLALQGHSPVIFEAQPRLGGMLRYGIPEYRLPKAVLDREIEAIVRVGVEARTGQLWTRDFDIRELFAQGFAAIFLGIGAWINTRMGLENEDLPGVHPGTEFLGRVAHGQSVDLGVRVAVIGGGNTAMDCARTGARLGADVTVYYRRSRLEMPAQAIEVEEAGREGVRFRFLTAPIGIKPVNGRVGGMGIVRMELGEPDASGRARPRPIEGSEEEISLDNIIVAIGQRPDVSLLNRDAIAAGLKVSRNGTVLADENGQTSDQRIFVAGDLATGPATVIEAVGGARRAAEAMNRYLRGRPVALPRHFIFSKGGLKEVAEINFVGQPTLPRQRMPELEPSERQGNFREVELGFGEEQARAESRRCLSCGCQARDDCRLRQVADQLGLAGIHANTTPNQPYGQWGDHPRIVIDDNKCIACRKCERTCADYHGRRAVTVEMDRVGDPDRWRGHRTRIHERCDSCGLCVSWCPTGALTERTVWPTPGPFPLTWREGTCVLCAQGCGLKVGLVGDHPARVEGRPGDPARGHLCRRGYFELPALLAASGRIDRPLIRESGRLVETDWAQALNAAAQGLSRMKASGPEALAGLSLGRAPIEDLYLFGKLVRLGLGTNNLDYLDPTMDPPVSSRLLAGMIQRPLMPSYSRLEVQDLLILIGPNLTRSMRLLEPLIHRFQARGGKLVVSGETDAELQNRADLILPTNGTTAHGVVAELLAGRRPNSPEGRLLAGVGSVGVLVGENGLRDDNWSDFVRLTMAAVSRQIVWGVIPSGPGAAVEAAGLGPAVYPGSRVSAREARRRLAGPWGQPLPEALGRYADTILTGLETGRVRGLLIGAGLHPEEDRMGSRLLSAAGQCEFLVVSAGFHEPLVERAAVVLPRRMGLELGGTYIRGDGEIRITPQLAPAPEGVEADWRIWAELLELLGGPVGPGNLSDLQEEMATVVEALKEG